MPQSRDRHREYMREWRAKKKIEKEAREAYSKMLKEKRLQSGKKRLRKPVDIKLEE